MLKLPVLAGSAENTPCRLWSLRLSSGIHLGWVGFFSESALEPSQEMATGAGAAFPVQRKVRQVI